MTEKEYDKFLRAYEKFLKNAASEFESGHYRESILITLAVMDHWLALDDDVAEYFNPSSVTEFPLIYNDKYEFPDKEITSYLPELDHIILCLNKMLPMQRESVCTDILKIIHKNTKTESHARYYVKIIELVDNPDNQNSILTYYEMAVRKYLNSNRRKDVLFFLGAFKSYCTQINQLDNYISIVFDFRDHNLFCMQEYIINRKADEKKWKEISQEEISALQKSTAINNEDLVRFQFWLYETNYVKLTPSQLEKLCFSVLLTNQFSKESEELALTIISETALEALIKKEFKNDNKAFKTVVHNLTAKNLTAQIHQIISFMLKFNLFVIVSDLLIHLAFHRHWNLGNFPKLNHHDFSPTEKGLLRSLFRGYTIEQAFFARSNRIGRQYSNHMCLVDLLSVYNEFEDNKEYVLFFAYAIIKTTDSSDNEMRLRVSKAISKILGVANDLPKIRGTYLDMFRKIEFTSVDPGYDEIVGLQKKSFLRLV